VRRWIAWAARLYPRPWRERYGEEFSALLKDAPADWRQLADVMWAGLAVRMADGTTYIKVAGGLALIGAIAALAGSYAVPQRYVSSAILRIAPVADAGRNVPPEVLQREADDHARELRSLTLARDTLIGIIRKPELNLYPAEREILPLEDVAENIVARDVSILPIKLPDGRGKAFRVSFAYPDPEKARAVVAALIAEAQRENADMNRNTDIQWRTVWSEPVPFSERLDVVSLPTLPAELSEPRRSIFLACGAGGGVLLGLMAVLLWRHPKAGLRVAAWGLAGCGVAGALSFLIAERYTCRASMRVTAPFTPAEVAGEVAVPPLSGWVENMRMEIFSRDYFCNWVKSAKLGFDEATAASLCTQPERAIGFRMVDVASAIAAVPALEITASDTDNVRAQKLVNELVIRVEVRDERDRESAYWTSSNPQIAQAHKHGIGDNLEILEAPTTPEHPSTHYRITLIIAGAVMGLTLGILRNCGRTGGNVAPALAIAHP